jgi:hypothetical protein
VRDRDPIKAWVRNSRAQRWVGPDAICASCRKEGRPFALIRGRVPTICFACDRKAHGRDPIESDHIFGEGNSDAQLPTPINDHRAVLSVADYELPPEVLENPDGDPIVAAAAMRLVGGRRITYIVERDTSGEMLLELAKWLRGRLGPRWWVGSPLEKFAPESSRKGKRDR